MRYILFLFFNIPGFLFSQEAYNFDFKGKILYEVSYQKDTLKRQTHEEVAELLYNDSISLFRSINTGKRDSARQEHWKKGEHSYPISFAVQTATGLKFQIINFGKELYTLDRVFVGGNTVEYRYKEPSNALEWKLHEDIRIISGFQCQKATVDFGGRRWVAWFTEQIPLNLGPYKFFQLPGLIVSVKDTTGTWQMDLITINDDYESHVSIDQYRSEQRQKVDKQEFFKIKAEARDNAFMHYLNRNDSDYEDLPERYKKRMKKALEGRKRSDNNWIEHNP